MSVSRKQLGKYTLIARIGRGGMAEVYKAMQPNLDRYVAIKLLHPFLADDPDFRERFEREARNVARLKHANIVQVYDFEYDADSESYYMVMELIEGRTLKEYLESLGYDRIPLPDALRITKVALEALSYAHGRGMIHRDLKPANLMLEHDGRVVLTDFGIAKIVTGNQFTASGGMVGTPAYMSPEQGLGENSDERTDLYSMGVILFQMVTGKLPFDGETPLATVLKHMNDPIPPIRALSPDVPESIEKVIVKAMQKQPEDRYQTAEDMLADVNAVSNGMKPVIADGKAPQGKRASQITTMASRPTSPRTANTDTPVLSRRELQREIAQNSRAGGNGTRRGWLVWGTVLALLVVLTVITLSTGRIPIVNIPVVALNPSETTVPSPTSTTEVVVASPTASEEAATPTVNAAKATVDIIQLGETSTPTSVQPTETATHTPTATETATLTAIPTETATSTVTVTSTPTSTLTFTPTFTLTPTATETYTPTATFTPSITPTATVDFTQTLAVGTATAFMQTQIAVQNLIATSRALTTSTPDLTATALNCRFAFQVVEPEQTATPNPANSRDPFVVRYGSQVEFDIAIRNNSDCEWQPGVFLRYLDGQSFESPLRINMDEAKITGIGETAKFTFKGRAVYTPTTLRPGLHKGTWEVRLSDGKLLGTLTLQLYIFGGG
ncbi:MAG: protein kinase [Anaerolineae bacterium]